MTLNLRMPEMADLKPHIAVFGVGGAGCNAVNNMIEKNLEGVDFVVANTDAQALQTSKADNRIQIGEKVNKCSDSINFCASGGFLGGSRYGGCLSRYTGRSIAGNNNNFAFNCD